jgi:hypothetical protein
MHLPLLFPLPKLGLFGAIRSGELGLFVPPAPGPPARKGRPAAGLYPIRNRRIGFVLLGLSNVLFTITPFPSSLCPA